MSDINITPLVDVMLVLVVIFIITAPLLASSIRAGPAQKRAAAAGPGLSPQSVTLVVDKTGQVFLNDQPVDSGALRRPCGDGLPAQDPTPRCSCAPTTAVPYGRVVESHRRWPRSRAEPHRLRGRSGRHRMAGPA